MNDIVFAFWEGDMPEYIKLCMSTWKFPYVLLNYSNLKDYTDFDIEGAKRFSLPQIADCVRVHTLRDRGGCWIDTDTIMLDKNLPTENILGNPIDRSHTIGYLRTEKNSDMFCKWAEYQDEVIANPNSTHHWSVMGNAFTDKYIQEHKEITVGDLLSKHPETTMIKENLDNRQKYRKFYFEKHYSFNEISKSNMIMLHNSWTPWKYKQMSRDEVLSHTCTLSNILRTVAE